MTFLVILLLIAGLAAGIYFYLPTWIGKTVGSGEVPDFFPRELKELTSVASENLGAMDPFLEEVDLSREELGSYVEGIEEQNFRDFVNSARENEIDSPAKLLDLAEKTIGLPPEMDRQRALEMMEENMDQAAIEELKNGLAEIPLEGPQFKMMFPAMKKTFAGMLMNSETPKGDF